MSKQDYRIGRAEKYLADKTSQEFDKRELQSIESAIIQDLLDIIEQREEFTSATNPLFKLAIDFTKESQRRTQNEPK